MKPMHHFYALFEDDGSTTFYVSLLEIDRTLKDFRQRLEHYSYTMFTFCPSGVVSKFVHDGRMIEHGDYDEVLNKVSELVSEVALKKYEYNDSGSISWGIIGHLFPHLNDDEIEAIYDADRHGFARKEVRRFVDFVEGWL